MIQTLQGGRVAIHARADVTCVTCRVRADGGGAARQRELASTPPGARRRAFAARWEQGGRARAEHPLTR
eukprot:5253135-Prymnesium_polylepis.1